METTDTLFGDLELPERFILGAYLAGEEREVQWVPRNRDSEGRLSRLVDEMEQLKKSYLASAAVPEDDAEPQNEQEEPAGITAAKGIGGATSTYRRPKMGLESLLKRAFMQGTLVRDGVDIDMAASRYAATFMAGVEAAGEAAGYIADDGECAVDSEDKDDLGLRPGQLVDVRHMPHVRGRVARADVRDLYADYVKTKFALGEALKREER